MTSAYTDKALACQTENLPPQATCSLETGKFVERKPSDQLRKVGRLSCFDRQRRLSLVVPELLVARSFKKLFVAIRGNLGA